MRARAALERVGVVPLGVVPLGVLPLGVLVGCLFGCVLVSALTGCGAGPRGRVARAVDQGDFERAYAAYADFERSEGTDAGLLGQVAGVLLLDEARAAEPTRRRAALTQLALAGTAGERFLRRLAQTLDGTDPARLGALIRLAQRGREDARLALRALADHDAPQVLSAAIHGMDPTLDRALLLAHLADEAAPVRAAAASRLRGLADEVGVRRALEERARVDADPSVRAAAVRALAQGGPDAVPALRERLADPDARVRLAAVAALFAADRADARQVLAPLLDVAPSPTGVEAARLLAQLDEVQGGPVGAAARGFLRRTLTTEDPALRAQAGVAIAGLPTAARAPTDALREALRSEADPTVRLALARALYRRDREAATRALGGLLRGEGMARVQAAALLAADRDHAAAAILEAVFADRGAEPLLRRTAVRALAREAMQPGRAEPGLRDPDPLLRIHAAGGILAAAAAQN